jgi:hypothetical protein
MPKRDEDEMGGYIYVSIYSAMEISLDPDGCGKAAAAVRRPHYYYY